LARLSLFKHHDTYDGNNRPTGKVVYENDKNITERKSDAFHIFTHNKHQRIYRKESMSLKENVIILKERHQYLKITIS